MKAATSIVVSLVCFVGLSQAACCPELWSQFQGRCYRYVGIRLTWFEAREYCYNFAPGRSHLVTLNNDVEASHVHKIFQENGEEKRWSYWIGLHDFYRNQVKFEWDSGTPSTGYTYWNPGEPNNDGKGHDHGVEVFASNRRWNDYLAEGVKRPFICEMGRP